MSFKRLVRFIANDGKVYFGDAILNNGSKDPRFSTQAYKIQGDVFGDHKVTEQVLDIKKLLSPLSIDQVRSLRMIGMNHKTHAEEINLPIPKYPVLFYKPVTALTGPHDDIELPEVTRIEEGKVDYEAELVVIIGKKGKDIKLENALDYVFGYTAGNDVSQRTWQMERGGSQFSTGKMFDTWAPIGPAITSPSEIPDPNDLHLSSKVNDELRQDGRTNGLIFNVHQLISFLSQGTTLLPGDLIFTGTPKGVGSGFKPPKWLRDNDIVEIQVENIGSIENTIRNV